MHHITREISVLLRLDYYFDNSVTNFSTHHKVLLEYHFGHVIVDLSGI